LPSLLVVEDSLDRRLALSAGQYDPCSPGLEDELSLPKDLLYLELEYRLIKLGVGEEDIGTPDEPG
jgi:hypothetical protein